MDVKTLDAKKPSRKGCTRACDHCRRMKIKCDGQFPCFKCLKHKRECCYETSKEKNTTIVQRKVSPSMAEADASYKYVLNEYIQYFIKFISRFVLDTSFTPHLLSFGENTIVSDFIRFSALSVTARSFGNMELSERFYLHSQHASKQLYDDTESNHIEVATGFLFLSWAASTRSLPKALHYANTSLSLISLADGELDEVTEIKKYLILFCLYDIVGSYKYSSHGAKIQKFIMDHQSNKGKIWDQTLFEVKTPQNSKFPTVWKVLEYIEKSFIVTSILKLVHPTYAALTEADNFDGDSFDFHSIPIELCKSMIMMIEGTEEIVMSLPEDEKASFLSLKAIVHQCLKEFEEAITCAETCLRIIALNGHKLGPCMEVVPTIFIASQVLLENEKYELVDEAIVILQKLSNLYPQANAVSTSIKGNKIKKMTLSDCFSSSSSPASSQFEELSNSNVLDNNLISLFE